MKIVLIGSGNVAWNLGILFTQYKHEVVQVLGSNTNTASALAYQLNTQSTQHFSILNTTADIYIIAVNDNAVPAVVQQLVGLNKLVVHTSGALPISILQSCTNTYGALYPLQSLVYGTTNLPLIPFVIQGNTNAVETQLQAFTQSLNCNYTIATPTQKLDLHIAAVFANNFTNCLYTLAYNWCQQQHINFELLLPLIKASANKIANENPAILQTGPAIRHDTTTIQLHQHTLQGNETMLAFYNMFTKYLQQGG